MDGTIHRAGALTSAVDVHSLDSQRVSQFNLRNACVLP